jgi:hypothetical protein
MTLKRWKKPKRKRADAAVDVEPTRDAMAFAIKAEVSDPRVKTFAFTCSRVSGKFCDTQRDGFCHPARSDKPAGRGRSSA